jgi:tetratricopeptide (TPR) repeat protein
MGHKRAAILGGACVRWRDVGIVMLAALALRILYLLETADVVFVRQLVGDAVGYVAWAQRIAAGELVGSEPFYQAPAYPYCLAILLKLFDASVQSVRLAQCVGAAIAAGMLTIVATWLFDRRVGLVAGLILAFYAPAIFLDGLIQKASLGCTLTCAVMLLVVWVGRKASFWSLVLLGIASAFLSLTRENALAWIVVIAVWLLLRDGWTRVEGGETLDVVRPRRLKPAARGGADGDRLGGTDCDRQGGFGRWLTVGAYLVGVTVVLFPVAGRNASVGGGWSISTFQAGTNFYIGNRAGATGRYEPLVRGHETPEFERADATLLAERAAGRSLGPSEVSRFWFGRAWDDIQSDPVGWLRLVGRKLVMVVNDYEVADAESAIVYADSSWVLSGLGRVCRFGVLFPLALMGGVLTWRRWRELWVFYALVGSMVFAVAVFYVMARYRYPIVPLLIPFAAVGVVETVRWIRAKAWRRFIWPRHAARGHGGDAIGHGTPRSHESMAALRLAMAPGARTVWMGGIVFGLASVLCWWPMYDRGRLDAHAWMNAGVAHAQLGELESATRYFRLAVSEHAESAEAHNNLAQALAMTGDFDGAVEHYKDALLLEPGLIGANYNYAVALEQLGRRDEALLQYRKAVEVDPGDVDARAAVSRIGGGG